MSLFDIQHRKSIPGLNIRSPFTIPSGIVTTRPTTIALVAEIAPQVGFLTTKTLSVNPREGYREPIIHEYWPGCFVNAVGLANPGARQFVEEMLPHLPLFGNKPLVVSIMGTSPQEFLECAEILATVADAFELNLSCPHVKEAGQCVGSDENAVARIVRFLKDRLKQPIIPKLSPNLGNVARMARICQDSGADALSLINTVGPGTATDGDGNPVLWNVNGGLSGRGVTPIGLKAVRETAQVVDIPIIASGGIAFAEDVISYARAGASYFAVGSALAGLDTDGIRAFFQELESALAESDSERPKPKVCANKPLLTEYRKTAVTSNEQVGSGIFRIKVAAEIQCEPGSFFLLRIPQVGEKPFSPSDCSPLTFYVRAIGPFTRALEALKEGSELFFRGPYGKGFQDPKEGRLILIGGGTGIAPMLMAGKKWADNVDRIFLGFSGPLLESFEKELSCDFKDLSIARDPPGKTGQIVDVLKEWLSRRPDGIANSSVFMCGPSRMMEACRAALANYIPNERIFIAREDIMRCGIGVCGSCATKKGFRSCVDGPVMNPEA
jgi:dihydroorotate dehydrogenase subfamily 1